MVRPCYCQRQSHEDHASPRAVARSLTVHPGKPEEQQLGMVDVSFIYIYNLIWVYGLQKCLYAIWMYMIYTIYIYSDHYPVYLGSQFTVCMALLMAIQKTVSEVWQQLCLGSCG